MCVSAKSTPASTGKNFLNRREHTWLLPLFSLNSVCAVVQKKACRAGLGRPGKPKDTRSLTRDAGSDVRGRRRADKVNAVRDHHQFFIEVE